eukprot:TRINITY_DN7418_c0_g1_i2.p1 TRINITY_DN7418_c0_g1~~TRINITY_DN7418_c0_g1_i2.p1  ORF type:complete len:209 (-),score=46.39 TRINITY_DN7418_c0_g1_i2:352-978(-)
MTTKPALSSEAIALTEKKMDMTLDDIIKMSKNSTSKVKMPRASNKSQGFLNSAIPQGKFSKVQQFMDSRSSLRQGVLAQKRSNFQGNQFPLTREVARKAATAPIRNRGFVRNRVVNWNKPRIAGPPPLQKKAAEGSYAGKEKLVPKQRPQTLDSLFANMKEQRMRVLSQQMPGGSNFRRRRGAQQQQRQQQRGRDLATGNGRFGDFKY